MTPLFAIASIKTILSAWFFQRSYRRYQDVDSVDNPATANIYATLHMGYLVLGLVAIMFAVNDFVQNYYL